MSAWSPHNCQLRQFVVLFIQDGVGDHGGTEVGHRMINRHQNRWVAGSKWMLGSCSNTYYQLIEVTGHILPKQKVFIRLFLDMSEFSWSSPECKSVSQNLIFSYISCFSFSFAAAKQAELQNPLPNVIIRVLKLLWDHPERHEAEEYLTSIYKRQEHRCQMLWNTAMTFEMVRVNIYS